MIVDDADRDIEMARDPFLEAGIDVPSELPYKTPSVKRKLSVKGKKDLKINDPSLDRISPSNSVASLAKSTSSNLMSVNNLKNLHRRLSTKRTLKNAKNIEICFDDIPKHFFDLSSTAPVSNNDQRIEFPKCEKIEKSVSSNCIITNNSIQSITDNNDETKSPPNSNIFPNVINEENEEEGDEEQEITKVEIETWNCKINEAFEESETL